MSAVSRISPRLIIDLAREHGFALADVTRVMPSAHTDYIRNWLAAGKHGTMTYLEQHFDERVDAGVLVPGARSVICVADVYRVRPGDLSPPAAPDSPMGRFASYAWGDDYHKVVKKRLFAMCDALRNRWPGHTFRAAVDTAPILEREHAQLAGLGWIGKHTLLINTQLGSYFVLGQIVTTLAIDDDDEATAFDATDVDTCGGGGRVGDRDDHCGTCTRCIDACPTQCIDPAGYKMDASRCISYLTIEHRGMIDQDLHAPLGYWIAGCDVCQDVCPFNQRPQVDGQGSDASDAQINGAPARHVVPRADYSARNMSLPLLDVLNWSAADRQRAFTRSALKRAKLDMLKRNALIAAGNYLKTRDDDALHRRVSALCDDIDEPVLVRETARQVVAQMNRRDM